MRDYMTTLVHRQQAKERRQPHPAKYYQAWQYGKVIAEGSWPMCKHLTKGMKGVSILGVRV